LSDFTYLVQLICQRTQDRHIQERHGTSGALDRLGIRCRPTQPLARELTLTYRSARNGVGAT